MSIRLNLKQAKRIVEFFNDDKEKIAVICTGKGDSGEGIYIGAEDDEGSVYLGKQRVEGTILF